MSVTTTSNRRDYTGDGSTVAFSLPVAVHASGDVDVYLDGVLQASGYTVTGASTTSTGVTVTFTVAPASGVKIALLRVVDTTQQTILGSTGPFPAKSVERTFDLAAMMIQQLDEEQTRAVTVPVGTVVPAGGFLMPDPTVSTNKNKFLKINSDGTAIEVAAAVATVGTIIVPSFTVGSIPFATAADTLGQNNAQLFWDAANTRLGVGTNAPSEKLDVSGNLRVRGVGPHVLGGAITTQTQVAVDGAFIPVGAGALSFTAIKSSMTALANQNAYALDVIGTINEAGSGTHSLLAGIHVLPVFGAGAASTAMVAGVRVSAIAAPAGTTDAAALHIFATTGATNNYALLAGSGGFRFDSSGPHALGGAGSSLIGFRITGSFAERVGLQFDQGINPPAGTDGLAVVIAPTIVEAASGTHDMFASLEVRPPTITGGAAALTNAATLKITGAPIGATNNSALWIAGGNSRFDAAIQARGTLDFSAQATPRVLVGTTALTFWNSGEAVERMRITDAGILALGTTVTTGAGAGDLVLAFGTGDIRSVNAAGSNSFQLVNGTTGDVVSLAEGGNDIRWGRALVALGGGATPTFGTIGGSGPATAAQNTWMRVLDSAGAAFWVPAWK